MDSVPKAERYSFIFDGNSQVLDHMLVTDSLTGDVNGGAGTTERDFDMVHAAADYNGRESDHDPTIGFFNILDDGNDGGGNQPQPVDPNACTITGTPGNDILRGTSGRDVICGLGGNDLIYGMGGNDVLRGGTGNDTVYGGTGSDRIEGESGNDAFYGERGNDTITGGRGNDVLRGGPGQDRLVGGPGRNSVKQ